MNNDQEAADYRLPQGHKFAGRRKFRSNSKSGVLERCYQRAA